MFPFYLLNSKDLDKIRPDKIYRMPDEKIAVANDATLIQRKGTEIYDVRTGYVGSVRHLLGTKDFPINRLPVADCLVVPCLIYENGETHNVMSGLFAIMNIAWDFVIVGAALSPRMPLMRYVAPCSSCGEVTNEFRCSFCGEPVRTVLNKYIGLGRWEVIDEATVGRADPGSDFVPVTFDPNLGGSRIGEDDDPDESDDDVDDRDWNDGEEYDGDDDDEYWYDEDDEEPEEEETDDDQ